MKSKIAMKHKRTNNKELTNRRTSKPSQTEEDGKEESRKQRDTIIQAMTNATINNTTLHRHSDYNQ